MNTKEKSEIVANIQKGLPPNWIVRFSTNHTNRVFYFNKANGITTWTHPETEKDLTQYSIKRKRHSKSKKVSFSTKGSVHKEEYSGQCQNENKTLSNGFFEDHAVQQSHQSRKRTLKDEKRDIDSNSNNLAHCEKHDTEPKDKSKKKKKRTIEVEPEAVSDSHSRQVLSAAVISPLIRSRTNNKHVIKQKTKTKHTISKITSETDIKPNTQANLRSSLAMQLLKNYDDDGDASQKIMHDSHMSSASQFNTLLQNQNSEHSDHRSDSSPKPDVEMQDISTIQVREPAGIIPPAPALMYVVVDTNVFLGSNGLRNIDVLVNWYPLPNGEFRRALVVIPWIVLQELDHLKTKTTTAGKARQAVAFLNRHFCSKKPGIRGQTIMEAASLVEGLNVEMNDDRILQCCFFFSHLPGSHRTILFSKDNNLCNKAMANHFKSFSTFEALVEGITDLCQSNEPSYDIKQTSVINCGRIENDSSNSSDFDQHNRGLETSQSHQTVLTQPNTQEEINSRLDSMDSAQELTKTALSAILETEMKKAYGEDLWLEIIIRKPPWTLMDVLQCIKKHWIAVFSMAGMDRLLSAHVDNLIKDLPCFVSRSLPEKRNKDRVEKRSRDFVCSSLVLVSGMGKHHMHNPLVKDSISKLKKLVKIVNSESSTEQEESSTRIGPIVPDNDENTMDSQDTLNVEIAEDSTDESRALFWQILDKIWECIIEHCVAIFRSLNFLSSPAFSLAPVELQHQLSSQVTTEIPSPVVATQAIPLLMDLIEGFLNSLERFLSGCKNCSGSPALPECLDLLQTLWTITRAFSMTTSLEKIKPTTVYQSCGGAEDQTKLSTGHQKLLAVARILKECSSAATAHNMWPQENPEEI